MQYIVLYIFIEFLEDSDEYKWANLLQFYAILLLVAKSLYNC